ncbi:MAG: DUF4268 domain-containing protein [Methylococcaceae bacterium]
MSAFSSPIIISQNYQAIVLDRIPLSSSIGELFSEKWLQNALFANPQCLPVREIDPHIGELIPVCTEIETGAGTADILYVTPTGQIVLVETKLWRNPEARREVIAQILDYAKQLTTWTYEDLARESAIATKKGPGYILACLQNHGVEEAAFVDGINRSLKTGDFLLLIVGDGIRSGAESLVGFIERYGHLRFGLGLIEVAAYRLPNSELLLLPRILAKTEVLQRTVLISSSGARVEFEQVASKEDNETQKNTDAPWFEKFWTEYLEKLELDDTTQPLPKKPAKSTNIFLVMPPGGDIAWISAYIAQYSRVGGVYLTFSKKFEKLDSYYEQLLSQKEDIERGLSEPLKCERKDNKVYLSIPNISFTNLNDPSERERVIVYLADMTNRMVNVFRHRLETISREIG